MSHSFATDVYVDLKVLFSKCAHLTEISWPNKKKASNIAKRMEVLGKLNQQNV